MKLSEKIRFLRKQYNLSQEELGKKIGADGKQICRYENDVIKPSIETIVKLADELGVTTDFLLRDKEEVIESLGIKDKELFMNCQVIDKMKTDVRKAVNFLLKNVVINGKSENYFNK